MQSVRAPYLQAGENTVLFSFKGLEGGFKILACAKMALDFGRNALQSFQNRKFKRFDAHVGDFCCQVRAAMVLELSIQEQDFSSDLEELKRIEGVLSYLKDQLEGNSVFEFIREQVAFNDEFAARWHLFPRFSPTAKLLTDLHILSRYMRFKGQIGALQYSIDYGKIEHEYPPLKRNFLEKNLILNLRQRVSKLGCDFLRDNAKEIPLLKEITSLQFQLKVQRGLEALPFFGSISVILAWSERTSIPVLLTRLILFSQGGESRGDFLLHPPAPGPFLAVEGYAKTDKSLEEVTERIENISMKTILLTSGACHPQYIGLADSETNFDPIGEEIERFKKLGNEIGSCRENPTLFVITHIFADFCKKM